MKKERYVIGWKSKGSYLFGNEGDREAIAPCTKIQAVREKKSWGKTAKIFKLVLDEKLSHAK